MKSTAIILSTGLALAGFAAAITPAAAGVEDSAQQRAQRWQDLEKQIFGDKTATTDDKAVQLDAPVRAEDAALVPISITLANPKDVKALYLVIDDNPSPVAAHFTFGPDADPKTIKLRVRINTYTDMHAVAETKDGKLLQTTKFVKASGGCSAPMGMSDEEAMKGMGEMKFRVAGDVTAGKPVQATLMIRHPNFNGMQMNQVTREYTPARYIQSIDVKFDDKQVFNLSTDISLATNPVISFDLLPNAARDCAGEGQRQGRLDEELRHPDRQQLRVMMPRLTIGFAAAFIAAAVLPGMVAAAFAEVPSAVEPGHVQEPAGLYQGALHGYTPNTITGGTVVDTAQLAKMMDSVHPLLLDVAEKDRKPPTMGKDMIWAPTHSSIPGAVFLQGGGNGTDGSGYADAFKTRLAALTGGDMNKPIVTFCHPDCWGSYNAAKRLVGLGYKHVYWYRDGVEGWQADHDTQAVKPDSAWVASLPKDLTQ